MRSSTTQVESAVAQRLVAGTFPFPNDLPVSHVSKFGDDVWTWFDPSDKRLECYSPDRLTIDWTKIILRYNVAERIVSDLKRYAFVRYTYAREVFGLHKKNRNAHPSTVVNEVMAIVRFLSRLCTATTVEDCNVIRQLSDIVVEDLETTLLESGADHHPWILRKVLKFLALPGIGKLLEYGPVGWNCSDIRILPWKMKPRTPFERLPEALFRFLSGAATNDVRQFLQAMNISTEDKTKLTRQTNIFLSAFPSFRELFEDYVGMRNVIRRGKVNKSSLYVGWCRKQGFRANELSQLIDRAHKAAELLITMYTGARLSELNSFTTKSLAQDGSEWVLKGTEIKRRSRWAPAFRDKWVAIPIVRDAVQVLTQTGRLVNSKYLFHHRRLKSVRRRLVSGEHRKHLTGYLRMVDDAGEWSEVALHPLRFRHSLVYELRKSGLGLPYITFQLKHYHDALNSHPSNVTVMYGNLSGTASQKAVEDANRKFVEQIYHPKAPVTGGGAELHKARREAYFEGMAVNGVNEEEVIEGLAKRGLPLTDTGTALCTGQRFIVVDGVKADPPCIGGLRCNPPRCANAIIPKFKEAAWLRISVENRKRAADPAYAHARSYFEEAAAEADEVIRFFHIEPRKKNE